MITNVITKHVIGVGEMKQGLYYLRNENFLNKRATMNGMMESFLKPVALMFAYNNNHGSDKFAPKEIASCFIGYPSGTKGYRLLKLSNMQSFVSRNVMFHKKIFPMNKNTDK